MSDGAGSASHSEIGSRIACNSFMQEITSLIYSQGIASPPERQHIEAWLNDFAQQIEDQADELALTPRDLACTFVGTVVAPSWSAFCQVGDGGIVVSTLEAEDGQGPLFEVVFWPEQGEYANETYFATMAGVAEHLQFHVDERPLREVALFSDGLQRMVLRYDTRQAFSPFFHRMLQAVRASGDSGELPELSRALGAYLGSPVVSERTDDDVSLILATRSSALADLPPPPPTVHLPAGLEPSEPTAQSDDSVDIDGSQDAASVSPVAPEEPPVELT